MSFDALALCSSNIPILRQREPVNLLGKEANIAKEGLSFAGDRFAERQQLLDLRFADCNSPYTPSVFQRL